MLEKLSTLRGKVFLAIVLAALVLAVQASFLVMQGSRLEENSRQVKDSTSVVVAKSYELQMAIVQIQQWLTDVSATRSRDGLDDGFGQAAENFREAEALLADLSARDSARASVYVSLRDKLEAYYAAGKRMAQAYVAEGPAGGNPLMAPFDAAAQDLHAAVDRMMEQTKAAAARRLTQSVDMAVDIRTWILASSAFFVVLLGAVAVFFQQVVIAPVCRAARLADELAAGDGDLSRRLDGERRDEIGAVSRGINTFVENISDTVVSLRGLSEQLNDSAYSLAQIAAEGERKAGHQTEETEMVATAMTEMKATADEIAGTAAATAEFTRSALDSVSQGNVAAKKAEQVIRALEGEIERTESVINTLGEHSNSIGAVLDVIRGVSEQTNLLALNAAIEAARAGEKGRGFAVVAEEVRTLASRTQQSTEEIQTMISNLQARAGDSIQAMEASRAMSSEGVAEVTKVSALLDSIKEGVVGVRERTHSIATAAEEQSQVSNDMDGNLVKIADLAKSNTDGAHTIAAAGAQLNALAGEIRALIRRFKTA